MRWPAAAGAVACGMGDSTAMVGIGTTGGIRHTGFTGRIITTGIEAMATIMVGSDGKWMPEHPEAYSRAPALLFETLPHNRGF